MSDKNIRMAILDDGVHPKVCSLAGSFLIDNDLSVSSLKENTVSLYSHGSMCARIVQQYTGFDKVDVFSIQILQRDTLRGNICRLLKALELCVFMDIRLVHLSVGTYAYEDFAKLKKAVDHLLDSDRFLVAAAGNRGTVTYPAYLPGVIGVKCHPKLTGDEYAYCYDSFTRIHFEASSRHKLIVEGQEMETSISNSYATPLVTAKLLSCLKKNKDLGKNDILRLLMENAKKNISSESSEPFPYPSVDIPVVVLNGFSIVRLSRLMGLMMDCLHRDDYHVRSATNLPGIRPWDETVLLGIEDLDVFTARMAWYFSCEIILLGSMSCIPPDKCKNASLWIYGEESDDIREINTLVDGQVIWAEGVEDVKVYKLMIDMLT